MIENIKRLTGQVASVDDIKQLTYMAYRFSTKIVSIETVSKRLVRISSSRVYITNICLRFALTMWVTDY